MGRIKLRISKVVRPDQQSCALGLSHILQKAAVGCVLASGRSNERKRLSARTPNLCPVDGLLKFGYVYSEGSDDCCARRLNCEASFRCRTPTFGDHLGRVGAGTAVATHSARGLGIGGD